MKASEAAHLITAIQTLIDSPMPAAARKGNGVDVLNQSPPAAPSRFSTEDLEKLYQTFKARFIDEAKVDPILVRLIMVQPELVVDVERRVEQLDGSTLKGRIAKLLAAGWFEHAKATGAVRNELKRTGADPGGGGTLSDTLAGLQRAGFLTREGEGWQIAPGVKASTRQLETTT